MSDNKELQVALDAMGGDFAPDQIVEGGVWAIDSIENLILTLVGDATKIENRLEELDRLDHPRIKICHANETVSMDESPSQALRQKRNSSIHVGCKLVKEGLTGAFISAGNTGAVMAIASVLLRTLEGIDRAGIAAPLPTPSGGRLLLLDAGANVAVKVANLYQFGVMGSIYSQSMFDNDVPRVGLLAIGEEESKGSVISKEAYEIMSRSSLNFVGNIEAKSLYKGVADVVVCDGLTGNIALKASESMASLIAGKLKGIFASSLRGKLAYLLLKNDLSEMRKSVDCTEVGAAPLLGVNGAIFIGHGASDPKSILNAIKAACKFIERDVNDHIKVTLEQNRDIFLPLTDQKEDAGVWDKMKNIFTKQDPNE
ncbi:MAG: phosphate acyltransferase PlsX [Nitrospinota bacterium]